MHICKPEAVKDTPAKGEYPVSLSGIWIIKFRMQTAVQINLLPFIIAFIRRYIEMD